MEAAGKKYSGDIDIRDIEWVTGNTVDNTKTEIFATTKVIQITSPKGFWPAFFLPLF